MNPVLVNTALDFETKNSYLIINNNAPRTWVGFYNTTAANRTYGFCVLAGPARLNGIWIVMVPASSVLPASVHITLADRQTSIVYTSNNESIP